MPQIILSINAGSSSLKVSVYKPAYNANQDPIELAVCTIEGLTAPPARIKYSRPGIETIKKELSEIKNQADAFAAVLNQLLEDDGLPEIKQKEDIKYAVHRVVHGGDYPCCQIIDKQTMSQIEHLSDLAPLHNAPALTIVRALEVHLPHAKEVAFFDTSFHQTIPAANHTYVIDQGIAKHNKLRKYGFHGISYAFITRTVASYLQKPQDQLNIIALHLGSGASVCAIREGKSLDTTMGLTPLAGLPGATRSGDIDASLIFHYTHRAGRPSRSSTKELHITFAEEILNKRSGWRALTGTTDFGEISASDKPECVLAFDIFVDRILGYVGNYYVKLGGKVDAIVFAGGIGERGAKLRATVIERLACLGFKLDQVKNDSLEQTGHVAEIGDGESKHRVLVCRTDEQLEMARGCLAQAEIWDQQVPA